MFKKPQKQYKKKLFMLPMVNPYDTALDYLNRVQDRIRKFPPNLRNSNKELYVFMRFIVKDLTDFRIAETADTVLYSLRDYVYKNPQQIRALNIQTWESPKNPHIELYVTEFKERKDNDNDED